MAAIDEVLHDTATLAKQRDTALTAGAAQQQGGIRSLLMALPIGSRVLDLVTGEEGVIVNGRRENVVIPLAAQSGS